jgi:hypothetical protein
MTQMQDFTGLPLGAVQLVFVGFALHGLAGALMPNSPTYSNNNLQVGCGLQGWSTLPGCWNACCLCSNM